MTYIDPIFLTCFFALLLSGSVKLFASYSVSDKTTRYYLDTSCTNTKQRFLFERNELERLNT